MSAAVKADPNVITAMADDGFVVGCCNPDARELTEIVEDYLSHTRPDRDQVLEEAAGWQPIETAPKDGTDILATANGQVLSLFWSDSIWAAVNNPEPKQGGGWVQEVSRSDTYVYSPTHWMRLPAPPSTGAA